MYNFQSFDKYSTLANTQEDQSLVNWQNKNMIANMAWLLCLQFVVWLLLRHNYMYIICMFAKYNRGSIAAAVILI